jgi:hypothetical protein
LFRRLSVLRQKPQWARRGSKSDYRRRAHW